MIEHRLYFIDEKLLLMPAKDAILFIMKGHEVFDLHDSLDMKPEYYEERHEYIYPS